jgi:ArsR family transcriptional regulator, arsenate/arsenite/antimonite-responsive transcriptional repressor
MIDSQNFFEALSDPVRRKILAMLLIDDERCVCDLNSVIGIAQPKLSRHLGVLRDAGLVMTRRAGVWMYYRLHPELPAWAVRVLWHMNEGMPHLMYLPPNGSYPHENCLDTLHRKLLPFPNGRSADQP